MVFFQISGYKLRVFGKKHLFKNKIIIKIPKQIAKGSINIDFNIFKLNIFFRTRMASSSSRKSDFGSDDSLKDPDYETSSSSDSENSVDVIEEEQTEGQADQGYKKKTRKRRAMPSTWEKNRTKKLRNSGKPYKTYNKKLEVPARAIKGSCDEKCRHKCSQKFTEKERQSIFNLYWLLGDIAKQRKHNDIDGTS